MRILITGVSGFIGTHLADKFVAEGHEVFGTTWEQISGIDVLPETREKLHVTRLDIRDYFSVRRIIRNAKPDKIFHLAAQSYPATSWTFATETLQSNAVGTANLFEAVREIGINPVVVVACSSAQYGKTLYDQKYIPVKEDAPMLPLHPYGVSKVAADLLTAQYYENFGLKGVRVRIFNATGPRKEGDVLGDFTTQVARIEAGLQEPAIRVGNLETQREINDIRDYVNAFWLLSEKGRHGDVYNLCSSRVYKIKDVLDKVLSMSDKKIQIVTDKDKLRPIDEPIITGDNTKIKTELGWQPRYTLDQTIKDSLDHWRRKFGVLKN